MPDFNERSNRAVDALGDITALPLDKLVERANKALADKEWPTAALLLQRASILSMHLSTYAMQQEVNLMKGGNGGT